MSCFEGLFCFNPAEAAATTIGKYYRGNAARGTYKKRDAVKTLATTVKKVMMLGFVKPRAIKVSDDDKALRYTKTSSDTPTDLPFADMTKISIASTDVKIVMKTGKSYTLRAETTEKARNIYDALSVFVAPTVMQSKPLAPAATTPQ
jgi:hypothetical protein